VEIDVKPDPPAAIREAILVALRAADAADGAESRWWRAGIEESLEGDEPCG
jgi:hypothetical protein